MQSSQFLKEMTSFYTKSIGIIKSAKLASWFFFHIFPPALSTSLPVS